MERRIYQSGKKHWHMRLEPAEKMGHNYVGTEHLLIGLLNGGWHSRHGAF